MRNYVTGLLVSACMLSRSVFAAGFCDNTMVDVPPKGSGHCQQSRATGAAQGTILPSYSDLDMSWYWNRANSYWESADVPISFTLDISHLFPAGLQQEEMRVEVLELGLAQLDEVNSHLEGVSGEHVLTIAVDRHADGTWSLGYTWLRAPVDWSIVNGTAMPSLELDAQTASFAQGIGTVVVDILPSGGWQQLVVSVHPTVVSARDQPPMVSPAFAMPFVRTGWSNLPFHLRSGVLGGALKAAGMQTDYVFTSPYITSDQ